MFEMFSVVCRLTGEYHVTITYDPLHLTVQGPGPASTIQGPPLLGNIARSLSISILWESVFPQIYTPCPLATQNAGSGSHLPSRQTEY